MNTQPVAHIMDVAHPVDSDGTAPIQISQPVLNRGSCSLDNGRSRSFSFRSLLWRVSELIQIFGSASGDF